MTQYEALFLFEYRDGRLFWKVARSNIIKVGQEAGHFNKQHQRREIRVNSKLIHTHRIIFLMFHGYIPAMIDHINRNKDDNRIENLREVTKSQNELNKGISKRNTSGIKGVTFDKDLNKWKAQLYIDGKVTHLGVFKDKQEAAKVVQQKRNEVHGDFAVHE
jgi:HNH endonuclease